MLSKPTNPGQMNSKKWFVLRTNPRAEKKVALRLTELDIENFLPTSRQLKNWHDRRRFVDEVLFKGYIFVNLLEKNRHSVFKAVGVVRYLFVAGKIAILTEKEIEHIRVFCTLDDIVIEENYEKGEEVEIISGQLIGLRGQMIESTNGKRLKIYIPTLDCFANITINKDEVRKIKNEHY